MSQYTEAEIEAAKNVDLPDLLTALGYHVKRVGRYHTTSIGKRRGDPCRKKWKARRWR